MNTEFALKRLLTKSANIDLMFSPRNAPTQRLAAIHGNNIQLLTTVVHARQYHAAQEIQRSFDVEILDMRRGLL